MEIIHTHTGKIYVDKDRRLEFLTVGDYGKENNIKAKEGLLVNLNPIKILLKGYSQLVKRERLYLLQRLWLLGIV